jgi:hypothetical protein
MKRLSNYDLSGNQLLNFLWHVIAGDGSPTGNGQTWYNSSTNKFRGRANGANVTFVNDGGDLTAGSVANTALTTNPLARANHTGTQVAATVSDFDTQVRTSRLDQMAAPTASVSLNSRLITNLLDPASAQDAATKNYVDATIQGFSWKQPVRAASTANVTIASALINGLVMDGVTLATGDRVLLKNQTAGAENGLWVVAASGAASRANDADTASEILQAAMYVREGTVAGDTQWVNTTNAPITLGTTSLSFAQVGGGSGVTAGNGLTGTTTLSVLPDPTPGDIIAASTGIKTDATKVAHIFTSSIGNGSLTSIAVTHSLGTKSIIYSVCTVADDSFVDCDVVATSTTVATFTFATAPSTNQYRVTIHG